MRARCRHRDTLLALLALGGVMTPAPAAAQATPISELWREWATLEETWRAERAERERLRRRLERLREARGSETPRGVTEERR